MPLTPDPAADQRVVALLMVAAFASSVSMRMCDPLLPVLAADFGVGLPAAAGAITGFALAYGLLQLVIGPLADRWGKLRAINLACALAALAALACALAPTLNSLVAARVVSGGVAGAIIPVALAWVGDEVPYAQRQPVLARVMSGGLMGLITGQLLSGLMADTVGWRWAFVLLAGLLAAVAWRIRQHPGARAGTKAATLGSTDAPPPAAAPRGVLGYWRAYLAIARPRWTRVVLAAVLLEGLLMYGALAFIPSALHLRFGLPLWQAALASAVVGAGGFAYTQLAPWLIRRLGERRLALLGGVLVAIGLLALAFGPSPWVAGVGSGLLGLGFYAFHNTLQVHGTQLSATQRSMGMALFALFLFGGQSLGVALASLLVAQAGYASTFALCGLAFALLALGFVRALQRRPIPVVGAA